MWLKIFLCATIAFTAVKTEPPIAKAGPYPPTGWRPQKPFHLPGEYLPPPPPSTSRREIEKQRQQRPIEFEISKARIDYIGQVEQNAFRQPKKQYEAPSKQQELPFEINAQQFLIQPQTQQQQYQPPRKPAQKYGPPQNVNFNINYPDPRSLEESTFGNGGGDVTDFIAKTYQEPEADFEASNNAVQSSKQGQYLVVGPENTIQRVIFTTTQDDEERRTNGFTAQLKYTPIGELKEPVFRYNNQGQLIRVLKKK